MPRKGSVPKRDVLPDPVYHSKTVAKFINKVMLSGKKSVAQRVVYDAFETIREKTGKCYAGSGSQSASCRRCKLSSSRRSSPRPSSDVGNSLAGKLCQTSRRKNHGRQTFGRTHGCGEQYRRINQEKRRHP